MTKIKITVTTRNGKLVTDKGMAEVQRGDFVEWSSPEGDVATSFGSGGPFTEDKVFHSGELAVVRPDAPLGKDFACFITLGGLTQKVDGVSIRPKN